MIQPVTRAAITNEDSANDRMRQRRVAIMKRPKDLCFLLHEHKFGQSDRMKSAKIFTPSERGKSKVAYSRRKVFWDLMVNMIASGYISDTVIDKIYTTYE